MEELRLLTGEVIQKNFEIFEEMSNDFEQFKIKLKEFCNKSNVDHTPKQTKKRIKHLQPIDENTNVEVLEDNNTADRTEHTTDTAEESSSRGSLRPVRTARLKAVYKEPSLNMKMRRPVVHIKTERVSTASSISRDSNQNENNMNTLNKKTSIDEGFMSTASSQTGSEKNFNDKIMRNNSIELLQESFEEIQIASDDEDDDENLMPPPKIPAIAIKEERKTRSVKPSIKTDKSKTDDMPKRSTRSRVKNTIAPPNASIVPASKKRTKKKKTLVEENVMSEIEMASVQVKLERLSIPVASTKIPISAAQNRKSIEKIVSKTHTASPAGSEKSVYEDAISDMKINKAIVVLSRKESGEYLPNKGLPVDAPGNSTFCISNETYVCDNMDAPVADDNQQNQSIMTDDVSFNEAEVPVKRTVVLEEKSKELSTKMHQKKREIFNPLVSSPLRKKVEAFEKHCISSPVFLRTRTRGANGLTPSQVPRPLIKSATPNHPLISGKKDMTPNQLPLKVQSSSTSKLSNVLWKQQGDVSNDRENLDELKKFSSATVLEEKRKRREEKMRLAQQQREQLEKEKREQAEKILREREEKHRKIMQEKEERIRLEKEEKLRAEIAKKEFMKKRKEVEQKRLLEERKREESERVAREQAELIKLNLAKENQHQKLQMQMHHQRLQQQQQQYQQAKYRIDESNSAYNFDILETDDTTDDENKPNPKRPPIPSWSRKHQRYDKIVGQSYVNSKVLDTFFSVEPFTPNLAEIFPQIDPNKLKRNSSAIWRTPPRYSQMPKY